MVVLLIKTFQKSRYVLNRYAKECDVIKLGWLPVTERFEFNAIKLAFKALHCPEWPDYLPLKFHKSNYWVTLRNSDYYKLPYVKEETHSNMMFTDVLMICQYLSV